MYAAKIFRQVNPHTTGGRGYDVFILRGEKKCINVLTGLLDIVVPQFISFNITLHFLFFNK